MPCPARQGQAHGARRRQRREPFPGGGAAALAGTYGTFTFNTTSGAWTYTLDQTKAGSADRGPARHRHADRDLVRHHRAADHRRSTSPAPTTTPRSRHRQPKTPRSPRTAASPTPCPAIRAPRVNSPSHDVDSGENHFQAVAPAALAGTYGNFTFNPTSGGVDLHARPDQGRSADRRPARHRHADRDLVRRHRAADHRRSTSPAPTTTPPSRHRRAEDTSVTEAGGLATTTPGDPSAVGSSSRSMTSTAARTISRRWRRPRWPAPTATSPSTPTSGAWTYTLDQSRGRSADRRPARHRHADRDLVRRHRAADHRRQHHRLQRLRHHHGIGDRGHRGDRGRRRDQCHAGDPSASGQLTVHDVDSGENHFQRSPRPRWPAPTAPSPSTRPPARGPTRSTRPRRIR